MELVLRLAEPREEARIDAAGELWLQMLERARHRIFERDPRLRENIADRAAFGTASNAPVTSAGFSARNTWR
jgi:hypothetical protein